jgi:hypothetical protein
MFRINTYRLRTVIYTLVTVLTLVAFVLASFAFLYAREVSAAPSTYLNFQARLKNGSGAVVPDGNYNIEFKLYNASSSSGSSQGSCTGDANCLWTETRTGGNRVRVANGYLTVNLGSVNAFGSSIDWSDQHWITMNIGGTAVGPSWDGEMNPRLLLTAVPFAFKAANVGSGSTSLGSTNSANVSIQSGNATGATSNSGNITIDSGTATGTTGSISLGAANASSLILGRNGLTTLNNGSLTVAQNLTVNTNTLYVDSGNGSVGIGTTSQGSTRLYVTNGNSAVQILSIRDNTTEVLAVANGGAVTFKNETDSANAFTVQRAGSGGTLFNIDTATVSGSRNGIVTVGASDTTATLLVLDIKTDAGDPTGTDGAIYYNSNLNRFRCYENGAWINCLNSGNFLSQVPGSTAANTITPTANSVVGLTVNGTSGTAAVALDVVQAGVETGLQVTSSNTGTAQEINLTNTSGAQAAGLSINRSGAGGTTTSLLSLNQTGGTATNGILFSGTIGTDITSASGRGLTITGGSTLSLSSTNTNAVTIDSGTTGAINIGTNTGAKTLNIGTGATGIKTINVGGTAANVIGIGNTQNAGSISLGAAMTTGTITIGGTGAQTGTIGIGTGTGAQTINLGTGGGVVKTINIGGNGNNVIALGNTQLGGSISLGAAMTTGTITIGGTGAQTGTIGIGTGTGAQTINLGTGGTAAKTVVLGSTASTSITTVQSGTGNIFIQAAGTATGTIQIGTGGAGTSTPDLLVLDAKNDAGDPTGIEGAIYYNQNTNKFRCYQNVSWTDCIGTGGVGDFEAIYANDGDKTLSVTTTTGFGIDLTTTGDFIVEDNGVTFATFSNAGGISFAPQGTEDVAITTDSDSTFRLTGFTQGNGIVYTDSSGNFQQTTTGGPGTLCLISTGGGAPTFGSCSGSSSTSWSSLTAPSANTSINMSDFSTDFTWGNGNFTNNLNGTGDFVIQDAGVQAFLVNDSGAVFLGRADGGVNITIGDGSASSTPNLLVLDSKNTSGDPAGINGAMYYNSNVNQFRCYKDGVWSECGAGRVYLASDVTETNGAAYTNIFTIPLTASKLNVIEIHLAQFTGTNGVAPQNRARISVSGATGYCNFTTNTSATAQAIDNILVATAPADTGETAFISVSPNPTYNTIACTITEDASPSDLIIEFQSETTGTVTTKAGSFYTKAVN